MSLLDECIQASLPVWQSCLETPFLKQLADGSLSEACFCGYIVDDSLYLREYAKVFAWGILQSRNMDEMRSFYSLLAFVNEAENSTRRLYLKRYGLSDESIQKVPFRKENQAYVDTMLLACQNAQHPAECLMAALPCMLSYLWIFKQLLQAHPQVMDSDYAAFAADYAGHSYDDLCRQWIDFADTLCQDLNEAQKERCRSLFMRCSRHEVQFWQMSAKPRTDIEFAKK